MDQEGLDALEALGLVALEDPALGLAGLSALDRVPLVDLDPEALATLDPGRRAELLRKAS